MTRLPALALIALPLLFAWDRLEGFPRSTPFVLVPLITLLLCLGRWAAHAAALGMDGPHGLSRWCDRATAERPAGAPRPSAPPRLLTAPVVLTGAAGGPMR